MTVIKRVKTFRANMHSHLHCKWASNSNKLFTQCQQCILCEASREHQRDHPEQRGVSKDQSLCFLPKWNREKASGLFSVSHTVHCSSLLYCLLAVQRLTAPETWAVPSHWWRTINGRVCVCLSVCAGVYPFTYPIYCSGWLWWITILHVGQVLFSSRYFTRQLLQTEEKQTNSGLTNISKLTFLSLAFYKYFAVTE